MPSSVLEIGDEDRATLASWVRSRSVRAGYAERARIYILAVADGAGTSAAARLAGVASNGDTWRDRFLANGLDGLDDAPRSGRPKAVDDAAIVPRHWSSPRRQVGRNTLVDAAVGQRVGHRGCARWRGRGVVHVTKPWRRETFKLSTDPQFEEKLVDVVGLYLNPRAPRGADDLSGGERPSPPGLSQQGR